MGISLVPSHARWSFPAGNANLAQFQFCAINASGQIITPAVSGVFAVVLDDAPNIQNSTLANDLYSGGYVVGASYGCVLGMCVMKVITGANLNPGVAVMTDASGHAIAQAGSGITLGYTLEASSSGDVAGIRLV
jgi:hypothetical protein